MELSSLVGRLHHLLARPEPPRVAEDFDDTVSAIRELNDPRAMSLLMRLIDDGRDRTLMFSLVHAIEDLPDDVYVPAFLDAFPELWARSPYWAEVLTKRILNSDSTRSAYGDRLADLAADRSQPVREVLQRLAANEKFAAPSAEVLRRL